MAIVLHTPSYQHLAHEFVAAQEFELGKLERRIFPDGERYLRILSDCRNQDVVIVGGTIDDSSTLELFDLGCTAVALGARTLNLVIPFFGYQTMERAVHQGEVVTAKTRAQLLSAIPPASRGNHVLMLDLHSEGIPHYFAGHVHAVHIYAKTQIASMIRALAPTDGKWMIGATDAGRAKWVESLANDLGVEAGFVFKRRIDGANVENTALAANVDGKDVIIYDDMIRSGSTLFSAADAYRAAGARKLHVVATHGLFVSDAATRLQESGYFESVSCTTSYPAACEAAASHPEFIQIHSIAPLLLDNLKTYLY